MSDGLDPLLRDTLRDLATEADVITDQDRRRLAVHAADQAQTMRTRRRGSVAAAVTLVTALAVGLPYGLRYLAARTDPGPGVELPEGVAEMPGVPTHVIDDASQPIELVEGWYVLGNNRVFDRTANTYTEFGSVATALPSPDGRWVATPSGNAIPAYRVHDLAGGTSRRYETRLLLEVAQPAAWSPAGDLLLLSGAPQTTSAFNEETSTFTERWLQLALIDPAAGELTHQFVDLAGLACDLCTVVWLPSGDELGIVLDPVGDARPTAIQVLSLDGRRLRTLPIRDYPAGTGAWSPDGRHVIVARTWYGLDVGAGAAVVEIATGEAVAPLDDQPVVQAQWIDDSRFITWSPIPDRENVYRRAIATLRTIDGSVLQRWILPMEIVRLDLTMPTNPLAFHPD